jgi:hypothetical protein
MSLPGSKPGHVVCAQASGLQSLHVQAGEGGLGRLLIIIMQRRGTFFEAVTTHNSMPELLPTLNLETVDWETINAMAG